MSETEPTLVIGAGLSGLSCARALGTGGRRVLVFEKSRGVGGRCATRRIGREQVDHGLSFYHGSDPDFLAELRSVEVEPPIPWPRRIVGDGTPCQPKTVAEGQERLAFAGGASVFPKHLARGLEVELERRVCRVEADGDALTITTDGGRSVRTRDLVLALPPEQTRKLLEGLESAIAPELPTIVELLSGISTVRCLTAMAGYSTGVALPDWDVAYPGESSILQMVSQDWKKRPDTKRPTLVLQGRARWSAEHWEDDPREFGAALLEAAVPLCGGRVTRPDWVDTQRWRYARLTGGDALREPLRIDAANGARIGIAGEGLSPGGGVEAAWLSGRRMAERMLEKDREEP